MERVKPVALEALDMSMIMAFPVTVKVIVEWEHHQQDMMTVHYVNGAESFNLLDSYIRFITEGNIELDGMLTTSIIEIEGLMELPSNYQNIFHLVDDLSDIR